MAADPPASPAVSGAEGVSALRAVLGISAFRRLWLALSLSSLGDWLGLLATTSLAQTIISQSGGSYAAQSFAVGGVVFLRLLPALILGPFAGAMADRFDRRLTMVVADLLRFALFVSIPLSRSVTWLLIASFLIEAVSMFWIPAKEASVPNLVPRERLEAANQLSLLTTYGSAPVAAGVFAMLALFTTALGVAIPFFSTNPVDLALYFNAATFLFSAATIYQLREIPKHARRVDGEPGPDNVLRSIVDGWR
ncbi:MAG: MFS transporter, partial [Mycobacterium leprae]